VIGRLWPFILGSVALGLDAYVIAGLLPAMAVSLHTSQAVTGLGITAFTGAYAIVGPLLAGSAGRRPRTSLLTALAVFTAANVATALAPSIAVFLIARVVAGGAAGVYSPLSSAVAAAVASGQQKGRALAMVLAGLAVGTVFGVPAGLIIAEHTSWRWSIGLVTAVGLVALLGVLARGGELPSVPASSLTDRVRALARTHNVVTVLVTLLTAVASLGLYTYLATVLSGTALGHAQTLGIWVWGLGGAAGALGIGRLVDRAKNPFKLSVVILIGLAVALSGLFAPGSVLVLLVALFCWGLFAWSSLAPQQHTLLTANPDDGATAVATNASANYLGAAIGSAAGAALLAAGATTDILVACAVGTVLVALVLQALRLRMVTR